MTALVKLVLLFFKSVHTLFFSLHALWLTGVRWWQILVKIIFQSLFGSLLNHLYNYSNENVLVKHLFNLHHLYFINTIYLLKNCSVYGRSYCIYSHKSFRFFWKEFHYVRKINKYNYYPLRVGLWPRAAFLRPRSQFFTIRSSVDIYLFQVTKNCDPWGTDHIQGQICRHVFAQNRGCCVHYPTNILQRM